MKPLVTLRVAFICEKCGDIDHSEVPVDGKVIRTFCCDARYMVRSRGLKVRVKRLKKKKVQK